MKIVAGIKGAVKATEDGMQIGLFIPREQINFNRALKNLSQLKESDSMNVEFDGKKLDELDGDD